MKKFKLKGIITFAIMITFVFSWQTLTASAATIFNNDHLRFGTGTEDSINTSGNLKQPFYYKDKSDDPSDTTFGWRKLTFSSYALDFEIREGGDGTDWWNTNGTNYVNPSLTGLTFDTSAFTSYESGTKGYGTIVTSGTAIINGKELQINNTYELPEGKSYMKVTTEFKNTSSTAMTNLRYWVGTGDDYVGGNDGPRKEKGNLIDGVFTQIINQNEAARALKISTSDEGVLFYTDTDKANLIIGSSYGWDNIISRSPILSPADVTGDNSYAFYVRLKDLAAGESDQIVWYYAAGSIGELTDIAQSVSTAVSSVSNVVGDEVDFASTSRVAGTGYYIVVPASSIAPDASQIEAGINYEGVTVVTSGSSLMAADEEVNFDISELTANTEYVLYFVVKNSDASEDEYSTILTNNFATTKYENSITFIQPDNKVYGNGSFLLDASADSGLDVSYSSSDTSVATVDTSGNVTITGAGTTNITASDAGNEYYDEAEDVVRTLTVSKKEASVTPNYSSKIYGEIDPILDGTISGFLEADNIIATYSRTAGETAGTYTISGVLSPTEVLDNYNITYNDADFTIAKRPITVKAAKDNKTYDGTVNSDKIPSIILGTLADGESAIWSQEYDNENVGTDKNMIPSGMVKDGSDNNTTSNYDIEYLSVGTGVATIEKANLTIKADNQTKIYGDANPEFTLNYTMLGEDESINLPTITCEADETSRVGNYVITIAYDGEHDNDNYNITLLDGTLTVVQREVSVVWQDVTSYEYDNNEHTVIAEPGNIVNDDQISFTFTGNIGTTAGDYTSEITSIVGINSNQYELPGIKSSELWQITKAPLTVRVEDKEIEYGDAIPEYTLSYDGLKGNDDKSVLEGTLAISCDYVQGDSKGSFTITAAGSLVAENYEITIEDEGTLTVLPLAVTVSASGSTSKIIMNLSPAVSGLTLDDFILKQGQNIIDPSSVTEYSSGARYIITANLSSNEEYTITADNGRNYDFSTSTFIAYKPSRSGSSVVVNNKTISITETSSTIFENTDMIDASTDMTNAFNISVEVKISDNDETSDATFGLIDANSKAYPFDISIYEKDTNNKVQPNEEYKVTITLPLPEILWDLRKDVTVVCVVDDELITLPSSLILKDGIWCIAFEAEHFSPYAFVVNSESNNPFSDVSESDWFYEAVQYISGNGLMNGINETTFEPNIDTTRGMIVTILYRLEGEPSVTTSSTFKDIVGGTWYHDAVVWGELNGIITGYDADTFGPTNKITREQMAAIIYRYANFKEYDVAKTSDISNYIDVNDISSYAMMNMNWAIAEGLISGTTPTTLAPKGAATRAQVATILMRFIQNIRD